jgi:hypothetical protein
MATTFEAIAPTFEVINTSFEALSLNQTPIISFGYVMQVIFSLLVVLGCIYVAARFLLPKLQVKSVGSIIRVEDRIGLEPQVTAYVISAKDKKWLVVVSNKNVAVVDQIEKE